MIPALSTDRQLGLVRQPSDSAGASSTPAHAQSEMEQTG